MPLGCCKPGDRGGLVVLQGRPVCIHSKWVGVLPESAFDGRYPFLERITLTHIPPPEDEFVVVEVD